MAAFCSQHKEDKATCEAALPVCRGFPLERDHSALSIRISLFSIMKVTFRDWLSMGFLASKAPVTFTMQQFMHKEQRINPELGRYLSLLSHIPHNHSPTKKYRDNFFFFFYLSLLLFLSPSLTVTNSKTQAKEKTQPGIAKGTKVQFSAAHHYGKMLLYTRPHW